MLFRSIMRSVSYANNDRSPFIGRKIKATGEITAINTYPELYVNMEGSSGGPFVCWYEAKDSTLLMDHLSKRKKITVTGWFTKTLSFTLLNGGYEMNRCEFSDE